MRPKMAPLAPMPTISGLENQNDATEPPIPATR